MCFDEGDGLVQLFAVVIGLTPKNQVHALGKTVQGMKLVRVDFLYRWVVPEPKLQTETRFDENPSIEHVIVAHGPGQYGEEKI